MDRLASVLGLALVGACNGASSTPPDRLPTPSPPGAVVELVVIDSATGQGLPDMLLQFVGTQYAAISRYSGRAFLFHVPPGRYLISVKGCPFELAQPAYVTVTEDQAQLDTLTVGKPPTCVPDEPTL